MERRSSQRIVVTLDAELILNDTSFAGVIENISKEGLYIKILPSEKLIEFISGTKIEIKIQLSSGEILNLHCMVIRSEKILPDSLTSYVGMEIIDPPSEYEDFLKEQKYINLYE
ncbi:MAG: PilZ domain-containing protein [Nitrospirota bacterium]